MARCAVRHCTNPASGIWKVWYVQAERVVSISTRFMCASCAMTQVARTGTIEDETGATIGNVKLLVSLTKKPQVLNAGNLKPDTTGEIAPEPVHKVAFGLKLDVREGQAPRIIPDLPKMFCPTCDDVMLARYITLKREGRPDQNKAQCVKCNTIGSRPREE